VAGPLVLAFVQHLLEGEVEKGQACKPHTESARPRTWAAMGSEEQGRSLHLAWAISGMEAHDGCFPWVMGGSLPLLFLPKGRTLSSRSDLTGEPTNPQPATADAVADSFGKGAALQRLQGTVTKAVPPLSVNWMALQGGALTFKTESQEL
jgi:hypothetical protein